MIRPARILRRRRDERGSALVELVWLGLLLLVPLVWIVVSVFEVQRGAFAVSGAARAAARAYVLAPDAGTGQARAEAAARQVLTDHGLGGQGMDLSVSCGGEGCLAPGASVTVRLGTSVRLAYLPDVLGGGSPTFRLSADHTVPVGRFREAAP